MLESAFLLLMNSVLLMLRIAPGDSFPRPLSRAEEEECLARFAAGDLEARNRLVEHNLRLVAHILKKYYAQADDMDDLLSIGTIGLIKGINSFRPEMVIIGGELPEDPETVLGPIRELVRSECFGREAGDIPILSWAGLGSNAGIIGAASMV